MCLFILYKNLALWPPALQYQLPALLFCLCVIRFVVVLSGELKQNQGRGLVDRQLVQGPQVILLLAVPRRHFCCGSLVALDVACNSVLLFLLDIKLENG